MSKWEVRADKDKVGTWRCEYSGYKKMSREKGGETKSTGNGPEDSSRSGEVIPSDT